MKDIQVSSEEISWLDVNAPTFGTVYNSIGMLSRLRNDPNLTLKDLLKTDLEEITEDNHEALQRTHDFLKDNAERFGIKIE